MANRVYSHGGFKYEDYDLKSISFSARMDKKDIGPGEKPALYLKATDENGLPIPDGRVKLTLSVNDLSSFKDIHVFIPDTVYKREVTTRSARRNKSFDTRLDFPAGWYDLRNKSLALS